MSEALEPPSQHLPKKGCKIKESLTKVDNAPSPPSLAALPAFSSPESTFPAPWGIRSRRQLWRGKGPYFWVNLLRVALRTANKHHKQQPGRCVCVWGGFPCTWWHDDMKGSDPAGAWMTSPGRVFPTLLCNRAVVIVVVVLSESFVLFFFKYAIAKLYFPMFRPVIYVFWTRFIVGWLK